MAFVQMCYSRALRLAIENNDWLLYVEAMKSIGDLYLEIGKRTGDVRNFNYALQLYYNAMLHCREPFVKETIKHRFMRTVKYCNKHPPTGTCGHDCLWFMDKDEYSVSRIAGILQELDRQKTQGYSDAVLIDGYTAVMVNAIMHGDIMVQIEALKSIGDVHLEHGKAMKDTNDLSRASTVYTYAKKLYGSVKFARNETLLHRLLYARKILTSIQRKKKEDKKNWANRPYAELHHAGDSALKHGDLDKAEELFSSALKQVHDRQSPRLREEEECLRKLGTVYVRRGVQTKDGQDFAKATALYNAALARKGDKNVLIDCIKEAERLFLYYTVGVDCEPSPYETDIEHKKRLDEFRAEVKARLEAIHNVHNPYQYDEDDPTVKEVELKRAESVRDLFKDISEQRKNFIKNLVEECIKTIGPPPCLYAMIGLGSQATELVTPYSDLEFAILIEENQDTMKNREYFLKLTCYLYLKTINLGETILPAVAIKYLNDFYSEDPADSWFYDSVTPRGFAFDGAMPWASKTPFGTKKTEKKNAISLIQTPAGMAEFQRHDVALAHGYHLSEILRYVCYLTGDQELVDDYMARVVQELWTFTEGSNTTVAVTLAQVSLHNIIEENWDVPLTNKLLDVKKEMYRFPAVVVVNLALLWGVYATSVWDALQQMEDAGVVTKENAHHLRVLVSISGELRLRTYLELRGQKENLSGLTAMQRQQDKGGQALIKSVFHVPDQKMLFRYYYTAIPLNQYIDGIRAGLTGGFIAAVIGVRTFYDTSPLAKAKICDQFFHFKEALSHTEEALREVEERKDVLSRFFGPVGSIVLTAIIFGHRATIYQRLGDQRKAISCWEENLKFWQLSGFYTKHPMIVNTYANLGKAWGELGDLEKSIKYHEQALATQEALLGKDAVDPETAKILSSIGVVWFQRSAFKKAIGYFESAMTMLKIINGENAAHPDTASLLVNLGSCWSELGDYKKAIAYAEEGFKMKKALYGQDTAHPDIATALSNLGHCFSKGLNDHVRAARCHEEAIEMYKVIYGSDTPHRTIAIALDNLGSELTHLKDYKKAISYSEQALEMTTAIHGGDARHPDIVLALNSLGYMWHRGGDKEKALEFYEQALRMHQELPIQYRRNVAMLLVNIGVVLEESGGTLKAIGFYEDALKMKEEFFRNSEEQPNTAEVLGSLGRIYRKEGDYQKALLYRERALETNKAIHGQDTAHRSIAASLRNLAVVYEDLADYTKAIELYENALDMLKIIHGADETHPSILNLLDKLETVCEKAEDHEKTRSYKEHARDLRKAEEEKETSHDDSAKEP
uniref:Protein-PII uridylyltransferase N-terminal domain-containing protein n=1 Tax=Branchiostoma floridae TaxID=7739 RepID=C3ZRJ5_BRAFL|eukprot:XP_002588784.1 hypothetical protein BRAFLDRAFT_89786 [Branchiostoma floridae]